MNHELAIGAPHWLPGGVVDDVWIPCCRASWFTRTPRALRARRGARRPPQPTGDWFDSGRSKIELRDCALGFAQFDQCRLAGADFRGSELPYATLTDASLERANFEACLMPFARLDRANLVEAVLARAVLSGGSLAGADCSRADLRGAILMGTVTDGAILTDALVEGARLLKFARP